MERKKIDTIMLSLIVISLLWTVRILSEELRYEQKIKYHYNAALYSVSFTDDDSVLQEELRFKAAFDGIRDRNFTKDFYITGKMNLLFETKTINFRFMSSYIRKVNRLWRTINMFNPVYFVWGSYNIKEYIIQKIFQRLRSHFFLNQKL